MFKRGVALAPGVECGKVCDLILVSESACAKLAFEQHGPEFGARSYSDGRCGGGWREVAAPVTQDIRRLVQAFIVGFECSWGSMIDGVSETLREDKVEFGMGVVLNAQHVSSLEMVVAIE